MCPINRINFVTNGREELDCLHWGNEKKIRLFLRKLFTVEHEKYANFILPKQPGEINFEETIGILTKIFGDRTSLFNARWNCLNLYKM